MIIKKSLKAKLYLAAFSIILLVTLANILAGYLSLPGPLQEEKCVIIKHGLSIEEIAKVLAEKGVISHPRLFEIIGKIYSLKRPLKSGEYEFTTGVSPLQVIRKLASGKSIIHKLVIPEGVMVVEIIEKLNNEELLEGSINLPIPEGYLMPSTYFYSYGDKRENIVNKMRMEMSATLDELMEKLPPTSPIKSRKDLLILASIVEKEAGSNTEKPRIAAVFLNRLKKGMKLQADPTTIYALTEGENKLKRPLKKSDLKIASPYNTYYVFGLPPGAISCPGKKSIEAVVNPAKTDDLYFVIDGFGGHNFSKTINQHNEYVQKLKELKDRLNKAIPMDDTPESLPQNNTNGK